MPFAHCPLTAVLSTCYAMAYLLRRHVHIHPILAALWGEHGELSVVKGARGGREWDNEVKVLPAPQDDKNKGGVSGVTIADLLSKYGLTRFDFVKVRIRLLPLRVHNCTSACTY
jgi:hypothetical protein